MERTKSVSSMSILDLWNSLMRLSLSQWINALGKILAIFYALGLAVFLFINDKIASNIGITPQQIASGFVVMVAGFLIYFDTRLSGIVKRTTMAPQTLHMREAFDFVFERYSHIAELRLYGTTTQLMVQWFEACCRKDETIRVEKCKVLTYEFSEAEFQENALDYNKVRDESLKKWRSFVKECKIGEVCVAVSKVMPQTFLVALDDKAAIIGTYILRKDGPTALLDLKTMVISAVGDTERSIIQTYIRWFDSWFESSEFFPEKTQESSQKSGSCCTTPSQFVG